MNEEGEVANVLSFPDKSFVRSAKLASVNEDFSPRWRLACASLLKKYFELRQGQTTKRYSMQSLADEILNIAHVRDSRGKIIREYTKADLSRQDLGHLFSGRSPLNPTKFRFIDFFINSSDIWNHEYFSMARTQTIEALHLEEYAELKTKFSPSVRKFQLTDDIGFISPIARTYSLVNFFSGILPSEKLMDRAKRNIFIPTHVTMNEISKTDSYVKVLFQKINDVGLLLNREKSKFDIIENNCSPEMSFRDGIVLHGYSLFETHDYHNLSDYRLLGNIVLFARQLFATANEFQSELNEGKFPYSSFSTVTNLYPYGKRVNDLKINFDLNRLSLYGAALPSSSNFAPIPNLMFKERFNNKAHERSVGTVNEDPECTGADLPHYYDKFEPDLKYCFPEAFDKLIFAKLLKVENGAILC